MRVLFSTTWLEFLSLKGSLLSLTGNKYRGNYSTVDNLFLEGNYSWAVPEVWNVSQQPGRFLIGHENLLYRWTGRHARYGNEHQSFVFYILFWVYFDLWRCAPGKLFPLLQVQTYLQEILGEHGSWKSLRFFFFHDHCHYCLNLLLSSSDHYNSPV